MKYLIVSLVLFVLVSCDTQAQQSPVTWTFNAKKQSDKVYDVVITAALPQPWHIYSQATPEGGPVPTSFVFKTNPLITFSGSPKEVGKLKTDHDENFDIDVKYYADKIEFVQRVNLKFSVKTNVAGTIEYMVCNDVKCLPPTKVAFNIKLQ